MNSIEVYYNMDTIFMNSENKKHLNPHRLLSERSEVINMLLSQILAGTTHAKI